MVMSNMVWERKHMAVKENMEQHERDTLALLDSQLMCEGISYNSPWSGWQPSSAELLTEAALLRCLALVLL